MKVIAVLLLFFVLNNIDLGFAQLLNKLNKLDTHCMHNCHPCKEDNGEPLEAFMGPCYDTPTCKIPMCCGIMSGVDSLFQIKYKAKTLLKNGRFNGNLGGLAFGNATQGAKSKMTNVYLPMFQLLLPPTLAGYSQELCSQTDCPQECGKEYTLNIGFRFVTKILSSFGIKADFVAEIITECDKTALCWGLYAELVSPKMVQEALKPVTNLLSNLSSPNRILPGLLADVKSVTKGLLDTDPGYVRSPNWTIAKREKKK